MRAENSLGKHTKQRKQIIEILVNSIEPITSEEIYKKITESGENISLSTIYRNIEKLLKNNILIKDYTDSAVARYSIKNNEHRHRLKCMKCNKTVELKECPLENIGEKIESDTGFKLKEHKLELAGYCSECTDE